VNIAYEAATLDLKDIVQIDHHHLEAYNEKTVNYNRDIEAFPLLKRILEKITGEASIYKSPTDMGVNRASTGIINDSVISEASHQEIIRRYFRCAVEYAMGLVERDALDRARLIMEKVHATVEDRRVVLPSQPQPVDGWPFHKGGRTSPSVPGNRSERRASGGIRWTRHGSPYR
jgi:uncharacterized protein (UPF0371 family)